ncbi:ATP synthase F1 subunit epsilon [Balneolaceae bacterium ANBcel3]|nr:ATP synthase F1 subunit epsilon [Balneolaceae bacterium ANBcel3]
MKAHILTPLGSVYEGDVLSIKMPGTEGGFEIRSGHAKFVSLLDTGKLTVTSSTYIEKVFAVSSGFTEVNQDVVTVLAEEAVEATDINLDEEYQRQEELNTQMRDETTKKSEKATIERELHRVRNRIHIALHIKK